jgi:predicted signal transduction protein with EAL and GGDEF domain
MDAAARDNRGRPALSDRHRHQGASLVFAPIVSIDRRAARIHALRCLRSLPGATGPGTAPWDVSTLPGALRTVSALPFDLDFVFTVGPTLDETAEVIRRLASPPLPHPIRLSRVVLEIAGTSDGLASDVVSTIEALRASCMRLSLLGDAASCSHAALLRLRPDYLTLPEALIDGLSGDADRRMVVESIARLAWRLGTQIIAEGLRAAEDVELLRDMGVPLATGALFRGPLLRADLVDWSPPIVAPTASELGGA